MTVHLQSDLINSFWIVFCQFCILKMQHLNGVLAWNYEVHKQKYTPLRPPVMCNHVKSCILCCYKCINGYNFCNEKHVFLIFPVTFQPKAALDDILRNFLKPKNCGTSNFVVCVKCKDKGSLSYSYQLHSFLSYSALFK